MVTFLERAVHNYFSVYVPVCIFPTLSFQCDIFVLIAAVPGFCYVILRNLCMFFLVTDRQIVNDFSFFFKSYKLGIRDKTFYFRYK